MRATMIGVAATLAIIMSSCGADGTPETTPTPSSDTADSDEPSMNTPPSSEPETGRTPSPEQQGPIVAVTISGDRVDRSADNTSELQSLMRIPKAVLYLKKKK